MSKFSWTKVDIASIWKGRRRRSIARSTAASHVTRSTRNGVVHAFWSPWHQDRPSIHARVISPDGEVHTLDENTIEEIQIPSGQANVFTDAKLLRAPLPALAVGCVVETEVLTREHRPFSTAGGSGSFQLGEPARPHPSYQRCAGSTGIHVSQLPGTAIRRGARSDSERATVRLSRYHWGRYPLCSNNWSKTCPATLRQSRCSSSPLPNRGTMWQRNMRRSCNNNLPEMTLKK